MAKTDAKLGDLLLFAADRKKVVADTLGYLRVELAKRFDLIVKTNSPSCGPDWPLFEYDEGDERWVAAHTRSPCLMKKIYIT